MIAATGFQPQQFPATMPKAATTRPAKHDLNFGRDPYIGGNAQMVATTSNWNKSGLRLAGNDFNAALAAARELSNTPLVNFNNDPEKTAVAVLQSQSGAYMLTTIWQAQFDERDSSSRSLESLTGLQTERRDLVAIVGPDAWLNRDGLEPAAS
jgi:hypothetical protein